MAEIVTTEIVDIVPDIGATGIYTLKTPFDKLIATNNSGTDVLTAVTYTCVAVRKVSEIIKTGGDPYYAYYEPNAISEAIYKEDVAKGLCIVTLRSSAGDFVYVPSTYIAAFPKGGGVMYCTYGLGISLGALPVDTDLTALKKRIQDAVTETVGVSSDIKVLSLSNNALVATDYHERLQAARTALVTSVETDRVVRLRLEEQVIALGTRIKMLEAAMLPPTNP